MDERGQVCIPAADLNRLEEARKKMKESREVQRHEAAENAKATAAKAVERAQIDLDGDELFDEDDELASLDQKWKR